MVKPWLMALLLLGAEKVERFFQQAAPTPS